MNVGPIAHAPEWRSTTLRDACELIVDCPHSTPVWTDSGPIVLRSHNIRGGRLDLADASHTDQAHFLDRVRRARPSAGDLVITREAPMGEVCMLPPDLEACLGQRMVLLRPNASTVSEYLLYALQSARVQEQIRWNEGTGSTVSNLRIPVLESLKIALPAPREQRAIARILGALDDKIELNRRTNETLEAMARAIFQSWFVDFDPVRAKMEGRQPEGMDAETATFFASALATPGVPQGWTTKRLPDVATLVKGYSYKSSELVDESASALVTLKSMARQGGYRREGLKPFAGEPRSSAQELSVGEIVVAQTDLTQAAEVLGRAARVRADPRFKRLIASLDLVIVRAASREVPNEFLYELCRTEAFVAHCLGHANGTTVLHMGSRALPTFEFALPPADLLHRFADISRPLMLRCDRQSDEADVLGALRDTLLPKLLSAELRVPEAERAVGAAL